MHEKHYKTETGYDMYNIFNFTVTNIHNVMICLGLDFRLLNLYKMHNYNNLLIGNNNQIFK